MLREGGELGEGSTNVLREGGELGEGSTNVQRGEAGSTIERVGVTNV